MANRIVFVHGMFQNPKSWEKWITHFQGLGYECEAPAWPLHNGEPADLRAHPSADLGKLRLAEVVRGIEDVVGSSKPILIGHSVGGLIAQVLLNTGLLSAAVAISPVAPNAMLDFDLASLKNIAIIVNPLKGDAPMEMDAETFHGAFANTLNQAAARAEFERTAVHDSRNVLRDCMGQDGMVDLDRKHDPLLLIGGEDDKIIPQHLVEKNADAYADDDGTVIFKPFKNRSHYICNEPGWEEVAGFVSIWLEQEGLGRAASTARPSASGIYPVN